MVSSTYRTGSWLGIVRSGSIIVLEGNTNLDTVNRLWDFLGQEPAIHGVLNEVTSAFGTGLTGLPPFAILVQRDKMHAILRGDITLVTHQGGDSEIVSGRDVSTWSEKSLALPESFELTLADAGADETTVDLPIGDAVVRLRALHLGPAERSRTGLDASQTPAAGQVHPSIESFDAVASSGAEAATAWAATSEAAVLEAATGAPAGASPGGADDWTPEVTGEVELVEDHGTGHPVDMPEAGTEPEEASSPDAFDWFAKLADAGPTQESEPEAIPAAEPDNEPEMDAYASFAMAADAEWSAQLAPIDAAGSDEGSDLNLTIRPALDDADISDVALGEAELGEAVLDMSALADVASSNESADAAAGAGQGETDSAALAAEQESGDIAPVDAEAFTTNYDHLWGPTVARSVEDAAVRLDENGQPLAPAGAEPALPPLPPLPPMAGNGAEAPAPAAVGEAPDGAYAAPAPAQPVDAGDSLMIDSVPWGTPLSPAQPAASSTFGTDFGVPGAVPFDPDHDGQTVMSAGFQPESAAAAVVPLESRPPTGPVVLARMCPHGHANPPSRSQCTACGTPINSEPREVGRPRLGTMHISTGESVELDHSLIIGRQPSVSRVMGGAMPRLVQVKSGNDDISRSHVEVRLDGWDVLLVDLKATNGTVLVREGQAPRRLSQGEEAILLNGDIAELGDGISLLFDGLL